MELYSWKGLVEIIESNPHLKQFSVVVGIVVGQRPDRSWMNQVAINVDKIPQNSDQFPINSDQILINSDQVPINMDQFPTNMDQIPLFSWYTKSKNIWGWEFWPF